MAEGGGAGAGRSTAIVLFTDLVGSTELRARLGEEAAEDIRRKHDSLVIGSIEANRGRLVKNLGDGVMATFTGASDAVAAAVRIQQALDRYNRVPASAISLEVRIGLSAGDVALEEGDCFGTPVIEAARLCAAAKGGQILASEIVRWLVGSGGGAQFTAMGTLDLKGLPAPLPLCEVVWEPLPTADIPMPALLTDIGPIFVGRDAEVQRLSQLWKEVVAGELRVALLAGEPGVGKTRLAGELAETAHAGGAVVLAGRCDEDLGVPYQPFVEALRHFVDHAPPGEVAGRLGRYGGELTRLVPELAELVPDLAAPLRSDPETERYRLFDAVAGWLTAASAEEPILVVLDDLQWAAKPTLLLLRHVVRSPEAKRLLILGTYRDTELGHDHPLVEVLADLRRQGGVERLSLVGLDQSGVAAFMEQAAGHALAEEDMLLARAIHKETEGNPFSVREVLRHLVETGALERHEGRWTTRLPVEELGIPEGVREVVGGRLSHLSTETNRVLRMAAVVGPEFELSVLLAAEVVDEDRLVSALEEAMETRLVLEVSGAGARYRFAHALVRDTLYDGLSAARRVTIHRRVAEAIESVHTARLDDHLPALAYHWARGSAPSADTSRAVQYATRAGDRALAQLAHDEAVAYYRQALELLDVAGVLPTDARRLELLISLGEGQRRAGDPAHRETLLQAARLARQRGDAHALARAAMANTRGAYWSVGVGIVDRERVAALQAAVAAVGDAPTAVRARLLATLGLELVFTPDRDRRFRLSDESLRIAQSLGDAATLAHVLVTRAWTINTPDTLAERLANVSELLTLSDGLGDPVVKFTAHFLRARVTLESGDFDDGSEHRRTAEALAEELGQPTLRFIAGWARVGHVFRTGNIDETDRAAQGAFEIGESSGQPDADSIFLLQRSSIRAEQDRLAELIPELLSAELPGMPGLALVLAAAYCDVGRHDDALNCLEPWAAVSFELPRDPLWLGALTFAVDAVCQLDRRSWAGGLYDLLLPYPDQFPVLAAISRGCTGHYLGMLAGVVGRYAQAEDHFSAAHTLHTKIDAPVALARTRLEWARLLLTRRQAGDAERARQLLGQALATARDLGLANVERRAVELLSSE